MNTQANAEMPFYKRVSLYLSGGHFSLLPAFWTILAVVLLAVLRYIYVSQGRFGLILFWQLGSLVFPLLCIYIGGAIFDLKKALITGLAITLIGKLLVSNIISAIITSNILRVIMLPNLSWPLFFNYLSYSISAVILIAISNLVVKAALNALILNDKTGHISAQVDALLKKDVL